MGWLTIEWGFEQAALPPKVRDAVARAVKVQVSDLKLSLEDTHLERTQSVDFRNPS
jgi:hypothetical protein